MYTHTLFQRDFQTLNAHTEIAALSSNAHEFCKPKSSYFMRETAVKRISLLYEVNSIPSVSCKKIARSKNRTICCKMNDAAPGKEITMIRRFFLKASDWHYFIDREHVVRKRS